MKRWSEGEVEGKRKGEMEERRFWRDKEMERRDGEMKRRWE